MTSNRVNSILNRGARPDAPASAEYRSYVTSGDRPSMGFVITRANGDMDGFLFHTLDNMQVVKRGDAEFLTFTHRAKAVTIQGTKLGVILRAIVNHSLLEINEPDGRAPAPDMPTIERMEITSPGAPAVPAARLAKG